MNEPDHPSAFNLSCPLPLDENATIQLAHGGGGRKSKQLFEALIAPSLNITSPNELNDSALLRLGEPSGGTLAFTTDSFVVQPLEFPGGNIGSLAVHGTVNDLAVCGARAVGLSLSLILEEGLPFSQLASILTSVRMAAENSGVRILTGDTKVVEHGKADGCYLNTSGIGLVQPGFNCHPKRIRPGDAILLSGAVGNHGLAVLSQRQGLSFRSQIVSDSASLWGLIEPLSQLGEAVHAMRDPTRGGVTAVLNEMAASSGLGMLLEETRIPVDEAVRGACEILGLDPLTIANEGKVVVFVEADAADKALELLRQHPLGQNAAWVGKVVTAHAGSVVLKTTLGSKRRLDLLSGEPLPRIC